MRRGIREPPKCASAGTKEPKGLQERWGDAFTRQNSGGVIKKPDNLGQLDTLQTEISPGKKYRPLDSCYQAVSPAPT